MTKYVGKGPTSVVALFLNNAKFWHDCRANGFINLYNDSNLRSIELRHMIY